MQAIAYAGDIGERIQGLPIKMHRPLRRATRSMRILQVEDSPTDVALVTRMLEDAVSDCEFDVTDVPRVSDALDKLLDERFDVVLLDLNVLDMNGIVAVAALHGAAPQLPIIVYSGTDDPKLRQEALMCGAMHYLVKGKESAYSLRFMLKSVLDNQGV